MSSPRHSFSCASSPIATLLLVLASAAERAPAQALCGSAHLFPVPATPATSGARFWLHGLTAVAPNDLWAVGSRDAPSGTQSEGFSYILHGDGGSWIEVPSPSPAVAPGIRECELFAVEAVSASEVYAAGWRTMAFPNNGHIGPQIFVVRWDGSSWSEVPAPIPFFSYMASASGSRVLDIEVVAPNDIWMFGYWTGDQVSSAQPLALRYDGQSFTRVDMPVPLTRREIVAAKAFHANDIWAVGRPALSGSASPSTYVVRWDGQSWTEVQLFLSPFYGYDLASIDGTSSSDFWIAGTEALWPSGAASGFALHWNGASFTKYPLRSFPQKIVVISPTEAWSFGTAIERWNGASWTVIDDLAGTTSGMLRGADALAPCDLWAVGTQWLSNRSAVFPLGARVDPYTGSAARTRPPCAARAPIGGFLAVESPVIGNDLVLALDDPASETGLAPGATLSWWLLSSRPSPLAPCGIAVPGLGPRGGSGEILVDLGGGLTTFGPVAWNAPGHAALHRARVPNLPVLVGQTVYAQGLFTTGNAAVLTAGLDLRVGR